MEKQEKKSDGIRVQSAVPSTHPRSREVKTAVIGNDKFFSDRQMFFYRTNFTHEQPSVLDKNDDLYLIIYHFRCVVEFFKLHGDCDIPRVSSC